MQKQSSSTSANGTAAIEKKSSNNNKKLQQIDKQFYSEFLSFQYDKEDDEEYTLSYRPKIKSKRVQKEQSVQREGLYLRAKFRFITSHDQVSDTSIYSPLKQLCWDKVIQVLYPSKKGEISCPICMNDQSQIVAPQITPCGHIYCYHCYLRHDDISDTKNYCPLCGEYAPNCDLKSAKIIEYESDKEELTFQLLMRQENEQIIYRADTLQEDERFSKIMIARADYIISMILEKERDELNKFMLECVSTQETWNIPYIEQALDINDKKTEKIEKLILNEEQQRLIDLAKQKKKSSKHNGSPKAGNLVPEDDEDFYFKCITPQQIKKSQMQYFYQEKNGQLVFLNPINNKYLFDELTKSNLPLPTEITAKVISLKNSCVDQNLLKRYSYLKHLPPFSDILFAEVDMSGLLINPENVKKNNSELAAIHKKLREKEEREHKQMQKNRKLSDNPYGQYFDSDYYLRNGLIKFPPTNMPTEEKHYPTLQAQQSAEIKQEEEQKEQTHPGKKNKKNDSDGEDDYVIMSKTGSLPTNYIDKKSRQKIKEMQNEEYFPTLGGLPNQPKTQPNQKKNSTDIIQGGDSLSNILGQEKQTNQSEQITGGNNSDSTEIHNELQKQNEQKQVIMDFENNVIIDGDQIYDEWSQQSILAQAKQQSISTTKGKTNNTNNNNNNNNNKKKNKKVVLDGNFFF